MGSLAEEQLFVLRIAEGNVPQTPCPVMLYCRATHEEYRAGAKSKIVLLLNFRS